MGLGQSGWFTALLEQELAQHQPLATPAPPGAAPARAPGPTSGWCSTTAVCSTARPEQVEHPAGLTREEQLSLAVLRTLVRLALDLADIAGLGPERRVERLTILFAAWSGHLRLAETLQTSLRSTGTPAPPERGAARDAARGPGDVARGGPALRAPAPQRRHLRRRAALRPPLARRLAPHPARPRAGAAAPGGGGAAEGAPGRGADRARLRRAAALAVGPPGHPPPGGRARPAQAGGPGCSGRG